MTKETLQAAISAMLDGKDEGYYHDELTLLSLVDSVSDESIAAAWSEVHVDEDTEEGAPNEEK